MTSHTRLDAVRADGERILDNLQQILAIIEQSTFAPELRVLMVNSVIVASVSAVEETLRQLFVEYLTILEETIVSHDRLRASLRQANLEKSTLELSKLAKDKKETEAVRLLDSLRRCLAAEPGYRLAKSAIANNKGNFKSAQVTEIAKQLGLSSLWQTIAEDQVISEYVGQPVGPRCTEKLIADWNEIYEERDIVVHSLSNASGWGAARVDQAIALLLLVLTRLTACLADDLETILRADQTRPPNGGQGAAA
ncbi:HEPN domain-containing protein [Cupriavidus alkaliphilus]|uniref:HEPN domain-containing protein n=1 Tax=Cupriavidus alkaliphilus TaxID=942866 RepID=UPI00339D5E2A